MRDDRYKGTSLPPHVRKLCRMVEREADRARPERLCQQAVTVLAALGGQEISPVFRRKLEMREAAPDLFAASELAAMASTGWEAEIARGIGLDPALDATRAVCDALRRRIEGYSREQTSQLIADRHPNATAASESFKKACNDAVPTAAALILAGQPAPRTDTRVRLSENLLAQPASGAGP